MDFQRIKQKERKENYSEIEGIDKKAVSTKRVINNIWGNLLIYFIGKTSCLHVAMTNSQFA